MMGSDGSVLLAAAAVGSNEAKAQAIADERKSHTVHGALHLRD